ncbi:MAG: YwaF family protein [Lachnospiraceae bacterium]|nr:YwaF family protein [Lachnospiraceae bacterium]
MWSDSLYSVIKEGTDIYFWTYSDDIPYGVGFNQFSITHIIWLVIIIVAAFAMSCIYKKSDKKKRIIILRIWGGILLFLIIIRIIILCFQGNMSVYELPLHLCSLAGIVCFIHSFFMNDFWGQVLYSLCLPGTILALIFPNWAYYPAFNFITFHGFLFHGGIVIYIICGLAGGDIRPSIYNMWKAVVFLIIVLPIVYLIDMRFNVNYMFLRYPSKASPLEWLEKYMGTSGYLIGYALLTILVIILINVLYGVINGFKRRTDKYQRNRR